MAVGTVKSMADLVELVRVVGFLPFFRCRIPGFSLEDCVAPELWYCGAENGRVRWDAWNWKGELLRGKRLIYGKFFEGRAGFVSPEWFPDFCNYRRDGYDFDARCDDGLVNYRDRQLVAWLDGRGPSYTREIRQALNYGREGNKGFETVLTRLQMQTYLVPVDYVYPRRKDGTEYGWGLCVYDLAEKYWPEALCRSAYGRRPAASLERMQAHLETVLPEAAPQAIVRLLG